MIPLIVSCPLCGENLMDGEAKLDGHPSIALHMHSSAGQGPMRLSALFGSFRYETPVGVEPGEQVEMFCPGCLKNLGTPQVCTVCGAKMARLRMDVGGDVFFCLRKGCKSHKVELVDLEASLEMLYRSAKKSE